MAHQEIAPIGAATGTHPRLESAPNRELAEANRSSDGKVQPNGGKIMPVEESKKLNLGKLASVLNQASRSIGRDLRFRVNMDSGQAVIQVLDRETGEIIREVPPEKANTYLSEGGLVELRLYDDQV